MKDAAIIFLMGLFMLISAIVLAAIYTGDIHIYYIVFPILFFILFIWLLVTKFSRSKNPSLREEFPQGKLSLEEFNRFSDRIWRNAFKFGILPGLVTIILLIILLIIVFSFS